MMNFEMEPIGRKDSTPKGCTIAMKTVIDLLGESQVKPRKLGIMAVKAVTNHNPFHPRGIFRA